MFQIKHIDKSGILLSMHNIVNGPSVYYLQYIGYLTKWTQTEWQISKIYNVEPLDDGQSWIYLKKKKKKKHYHFTYRII